MKYTKEEEQTGIITEKELVRSVCIISTINEKHMENKITLYDTLEAEKEIEEFESLSEEAKDEYIQAIKAQKEDIIDNRFRYIKDLEARSKAIDEEIERLKEYKDYIKNRVTRIKASTLYSMERWNVERIEGKTTRCYIRTDKSVVVTDEKAIPTKFKGVKMTVTIDKASIKKAIQNGEEIEGVNLVSNKSLTIK